MINRRWDDVVTITVWLAFLLVAAGMIAGGFLTVRPRAPLTSHDRSGRFVSVPVRGLRDAEVAGSNPAFPTGRSSRLTSTHPHIWV